VEGWLKSIGLEARVPAFRAHGITMELLRDLTDSDLRELGLTIGERKRFYRAITELDAAEPPAAAASPSPGASEAHAERRPLSTLFVDLVGYTRLSERLDPEDMLVLLRRYRELCAAHVTRFGGYVARVVGDGVLAYFCYPMANENDPERAVRAGLEIAAGIGGLTAPDGERLRARLGIATGPVVIGDLYRDSAVDKHSVVGSAPNLAARLQALAKAGELIVDEGTHARVRGRFVAADLGPLELRGLDLPQRAFRILRERPIGDVASVPHQAPLCGRDRELASLRAAWGRARDGEGGTVLVVGKAGIGKSRLVRAFLDSCVGDGGVTVQIHASALDTDSPLRAVVAALRRLTGGGGQAGGAARLRRLASLGLPEATLPVVADLLGLPSAIAREEVAPASPEQRREETLHALVAAALAVADRQRLRLVFEDIHWLDPTSLDLVARLAAEVGGRRMLLVLTAREELRSEQATLPASHAVLPLQPLPEVEVLRLVSAMVDGHAMPPGVLRSIARRAEGVPLFAQELLRTVAIRRNAEPADEEAEFGGVVPASVHAALIARLDRTGPAKEIAQAAAVFGRVCRRDALAAVCGPLFGTSAADLDAAIATLIRTGVFVGGAADVAPVHDGGGSVLTFAHALLRDAAYESLIRDRRQTLHLLAAAALRVSEPETVAEQPERLALHLTEGGDPLAAAPLWLEAARRSLARSALTEATRLLRRAVASLPRASQDRAAAEARLEMLALLGPALMALHGNASSEAAEVYAEANALCQELPETPAHFPIYWGWWYQSRDFHDKRDRASTMLSRARARGDQELMLQAHHCAWGSYYCAGEFARCREHIEAGLSIYDRKDCRHHARLYANHDAKVCAHGELAQVLWMQGKPLRALTEEARSLDWAAEVDHLGSVSHARDMQLLHRVFRRDHDFVFQRAGEFVSFGSDTGMMGARAKGLIFRGWATAVREDPAAGLRSLESGFEQQKATGTNEDFPIYLCLLAEALVSAGKPERALALLEEAEAEHAAMGLGFWCSELRRMRAEAVLAADPAAADLAATLFDEARSLAEDQGAVMLALRAAVGAARLASTRGDAAGARRRLAPILGRIEGHDGSADLLVAHALSARLAGLLD
jgi:class 3 adenylate cyclase/predicted ATPase